MRTHVIDLKIKKTKSDVDLAPPHFSRLAMNERTKLMNACLHGPPSHALECLLSPLIPLSTNQPTVLPRSAAVHCALALLSQNLLSDS